MSRKNRAILQIEVIDNDMDRAARNQARLEREANRAGVSVDTLQRQMRAADRTAGALDRTAARLTLTVQGLGTRAASMGTALVGLGAGVMGLGSAAAALRTGLRTLREGMAEYVRGNEEAKAATDALAESKRRWRAAIGEAILGGQNLQLVTGALQGVYESLTDTLQGNHAALQDLVRNGLAMLVEGMGWTARAIGVAVNAGRALYMGWLTLKLGAVGLVAAISSIGVAMLQAIVEPATLSAQALARLLELTASAARWAGMDAMASGIEHITANVQDMADQHVRFRDGLRGLQSDIGGGMQEAWQEYAAAMGETVDAMVETDRVATEIQDRFRAVAEGVRTGRIEVRDYGAAMAEVGDEIRGVVAAHEELAEVVDRKALAIEKAQQELELWKQQWQAQYDLKFAVEETAEAWSGMQDLALSAMGAMEGALVSFGRGIGEALVGQGMGAADMVKKIIGDMLVSVGSAAIGIGTVSLAGALFPPLQAVTGPAALAPALIAAGVAAVAAGSAMGASAKAGASAAPASMGVSGGSSGASQGGTTTIYNVELGAGIPRRARQRAVLEEATGPMRGLA